MKVLAFGEGSHEIGQRFWDKAAADFKQTEGWLQPLARRSALIPIHIDARSWQKLPNFPRKKPKSISTAIGAKAAMARITAANDEFDAVIFMADADSNEKKDWDAKTADIQEGLNAVENPVQVVACIPMSASECWLLADRKAWEELGLQESARFPNAPEAVWGPRHEPEHDHPKHVFAAVCSDAHLSDDVATRCQIAELIDLDVLAEKCPVSYPPFRVAISSLTEKS